MIWKYMTVLAWIITAYSIVGAVWDIISWKTSWKSKETARPALEEDYNLGSEQLAGDPGTVWDDLKERFWVLVFSVGWLITCYCL